MLVCCMSRARRQRPAPTPVCCHPPRLRLAQKDKPVGTTGLVTSQDITRVHKIRKIAAVPNNNELTKHLEVDFEVPGSFGGGSMAQSTKQPQGREALLKSYNKRLKDDVKSILDNFMEIVKLGMVEDETQIARMTQVEEINFQMQVRSANMVRAAESLMKLVADVKQYLILNDFPSVNEAITHNSTIFKTKSLEADQKLMALRDDMASDLYELEEEFYSSIYKEK
ncbi:mediator of RNA polymerase II transcription subunit 22-like isoform X1 [Scylla paramamosain]|uniref:mediator of RNA polymerase II transcription subunit 22-like isoform X1 n=2 Tax=Scylla paramamosain TaxID=85552 RepID=UPI003082C3EF